METSRDEAELDCAARGLIPLCLANTVTIEAMKRGMKLGSTAHAYIQPIEHVRR